MIIFIKQEKLFIIPGKNVSYNYVTLNKIIYNYIQLYIIIDIFYTIIYTYI